MGARQGEDQRLTIVMYHFVRDLAKSRFPDLKGLDKELFVNQMEVIATYYDVVRMEDVVGAVMSLDKLPENAALLTFDDGYFDHYDVVWPILQKFGFQGSFFPPVKAITRSVVLDVNKIQFTLASGADPVHLTRMIFDSLDKNRYRLSLPTNEQLFAELSKQSRYDDPNTTFVKRALQHTLPLELRSELVDELFAHYVTADEASFSRELYLSEDNLKEMFDAGMFIGSHGYDHFWLNKLSPQDQVTEVDLSLEFLGSLGVPTANWVMCYPYGGYDDSVVELIESRGCSVGLTTDVAIARIGADSPLTLPRLDTNDLPQHRSELKNNRWIPLHSRSMNS